MDLKPKDLDRLVEELKASHAIFSPLFQRAEQRGWASLYLQGLLSDIERKSVEPMAQQIEGGHVRNMQQFLGAGTWDDDPILAEHERQVRLTLGTGEGVLQVDGSGFPKQGKESVGVMRQYCGALGKVANCQSGVFVGYGVSTGYTLLNRRLYLPKLWFSPEYKKRWQRCGIPKGTPFRTHGELAWEMIQEISVRGELRFQWITFDEEYGKDPWLLDQVAGVGKYYLAEVPVTTPVWFERPATRQVTRRRKGKVMGKEALVNKKDKPIEVRTLVSQVKRWTTKVIKEGSKGPMVAEFAAVRAVAVRDTLPGPDVWVVFRRTLGAEPELKIYLSNAPADTPLSTLAQVSGWRWPIETMFEDGKGLLGMDQYETRSWRGWHHHMTLVILAHHFLVRLGRRLKKKSPALTLPQVRLLLQVVLPQKELDATEALRLIRYTQARNHAAYKSHRKRKLIELRKLKPKLSL
jgi:SRSO17 transposase